MKIKCTNCNYKFKGDYSKLEKNCPYCGKKGYLEVEDIEEEIIKNIDEML